MEREEKMREELLRRTRIPKEYWPPEDAWPYVKPTRFVEWTEEFNLARYLVERNVEEGRGGKPAIFFEKEAITYDELSRASNKLGSSLKRLGIRSGDRVAIRLSNRPEFVISDFAIQKIGGIVVPMFVLLKAPSIAYILRDAEVKTIIVEADLLDEVEKAGVGDLEHIIVFRGTKAHKEKGYLLWEELLEEGEEDLESEDIYYHDVAMIHYTSGTTGPPKGCIQTPVGLLGHVAGTVNRAGIREEDVICISPPLPFAYGHALLMYTFYVGASCVLLERFTSEEFLTQAARYKATVLAGVPTAYRMMLPEMRDYDLAEVRLLMTAGETFTEELESALKEVFPKANLFNFYGYTEMWNFIGTIPGVHPPTSLGTPYDEYEVKIVDEKTGEELPSGKVGVIMARGAAGALYWRLPDKQRELVRDGWFRSGDLAYRDEKGIVWFKARDVDVIKSSGYLIAPYEIEAVLSRHPAVAMVGCIGIPDVVKGEIVKAYIKLKPGYEPGDKLVEELEKFAEERLERYKVPKRWEFIDEMPTTLSGKVLRRGLKEMEFKRTS
ncbi:MAG: hypothetical protein DRG83_13650 [Deltaproteobacteria bacterium]|nr:MAG: hypothetical protein DRG83_13650 [Deltaproteobacteria bacterium]